MATSKLDELTALGAKVEAELALLREDAAAMDRSLSALKRTTAELRQDVTRLVERACGIETRLERIELRLDVEATWRWPQRSCDRAKPTGAGGVAAADRGRRSERDQRSQRRRDFR